MSEVDRGEVAPIGDNVGGGDDGEEEGEDESQGRWGPQGMADGTTSTMPRKNRMMMITRKKKIIKNQNRGQTLVYNNSNNEGLKGLSKAKKVVLFLFPFITTNPRKHRPPNNSNNSINTTTLSSSYLPSSTSSSTSAGEATTSCCLCFYFKQPPPPALVASAGSPSVDSHTSDPNEPAFTFDMLRSFMEKNDFYSKESNPHLS